MFFLYSGGDEISMKFREGTNYDYETDYDLWKNKSVVIGINFNLDNYDISKYTDTIRGFLEWLNKKRHVVEQAILENNMTESAEYWVSRNKQSADGSYIMKDGSTVSLPINDDDFCKSLKFPEVVICIEDNGDCNAELYFRCSPDYFDGHSIEVFIDNDKNISCDGLAG